ncbi:MAG: amidohydrolase [Anaerolineaceae bacterium]|nr:amidohydrolase [Anaerolineaceae bacterium]
MEEDMRALQDIAIDLMDIPVVDIHCHPYARKEKLTADEWVDATAFGGGSRQYLEDGGITVDENALNMLQQVKRDTLYFRYMVYRLGEYFDCEPDVNAIVAARNSLIEEKGYQGYTNHLLKAANIATLITDFGYPKPAPSVETFQEDAGIEVVPIFRIEGLIKELLDSDCGWPEFKRRYDQEISEKLTSGGYKGLKSIIAYRSGLDISPLSRTPDQGMAALDIIRHGRGGGRDAVKDLRDHLFCRAIELCIEHSVPFQVHTGIGDWEVNLAACRPALLMDLLRFPAFRACKILLVHSGYPYHAEAGYMANVLPNIWCDISEGLPFAGNGAKRILAEVLEMAPVARVCYGSDTIGSPELCYTSALLGRQAVHLVLAGLVQDGFLSKTDVKNAAGRILGDNARELYGL